MHESEISLWEVLKLMKLGASRTILKEKYNLSEEGLRDLYKQLAQAGFLEWDGQDFVLAAKRRIDTNELVTDIHSGLTDVELMEKYKLSSRGLQRVFTKLVDSGAVMADDLTGRSVSYDDSVTLKKVRGSVRALPILSIDIYEKNYPQIMGRIRDLSEFGVGVRGLVAEVGDLKSLVVVPDEFLEIEPFSFEAKCCWVRREDGGKIWSSGFEITDIEEDSLIQLQELLQLMTYSFSDKEL
ncbi:MAG: PilZ domain-containing protein [Desulfomonilaceae bacterium]